MKRLLVVVGLLTVLLSSGCVARPRDDRPPEVKTAARVPVPARNAQEIAYDAARAEDDLAVVKHSWTKGGFGSIALWTVTIKNTSTVVEYKDIEYSTIYAAPSGTRVGTRQGWILDRIPPGKSKTFEVNDGFINSQAEKANFAIASATKMKAQKSRP